MVTEFDIGGVIYKVEHSQETFAAYFKERLYDFYHVGKFHEKKLEITYTFEDVELLHKILVSGTGDKLRIDQEEDVDTGEITLIQIIRLDRTGDAEICDANGWIYSYSDRYYVKKATFVEFIDILRINKSGDTSNPTENQKEAWKKEFINN